MKKKFTKQKIKILFSTWITIWVKEGGASFLINYKLNDTELKGISDHIVLLKVKIQNNELVVLIQVYAPTSNLTDNEKKKTFSTTFIICLEIEITVKDEISEGR